MAQASTTAPTLAYSADGRPTARGPVWAAAWSRFAHAPVALAAKYAEQRRINRAIAELSGLSDRMLADIGVQRHDIESIARNGRDASAIRR